MSSNCMQYNMPRHWIGMGVKGRKSSECPQVVDTADLAMVEIYPIKSTCMLSFILSENTTIQNCLGLLQSEEQ